MEKTSKGEKKENFLENFFKPRPNLEYELYKQKKTIGRTLNTNIGMFFFLFLIFILY